MKKMYLLLFAALSAAFGIAQTSGQHEVIGSSGEQLKTSQGSVSFTVGEVTTKTFKGTSGGVDLTQGFQQSYFQIEDVSEISENSIKEFKVKVWPNPTLRYLNIDIGDSKEGEYIQAEIIDVSGVKLEEFNVVENPKIDLDAYPVSNYFLRIYDTKSMRVRMFKIIKL